MVRKGGQVIINGLQRAQMPGSHVPPRDRFPEPIVAKRLLYSCPKSNTGAASEVVHISSVADAMQRVLGAKALVEVTCFVCCNASSITCREHVTNNGSFTAGFVPACTRQHGPPPLCRQASQHQLGQHALQGCITARGCRHHCQKDSAGRKKAARGCAEAALYITNSACCPLLTLSACRWRASSGYSTGSLGGRE